jgi:AraC-like DNA-binding protein
MTPTQKVIAQYNELEKKDIAWAVYDYHVEMCRKRKLAVPGHFTEGSWSIEDTASAFHMSKSGVSQLLTDIGRPIMKIKKEMKEDDKDSKV